MGACQGFTTRSRYTTAQGLPQQQRYTGQYCRMHTYNCFIALLTHNSCPHAMHNSCPHAMHNSCPHAMHNSCPHAMHNSCPHAMHNSCPHAMHNSCPHAMHNSCPHAMHNSCPHAMHNSLSSRRARLFQSAVRRHLYSKVHVPIRLGTRLGGVDVIHNQRLEP